jgi:hypothetical protein
LLIFDEQINRETAIEPLRSWAKIHRLKDVRPKEFIDDDRIPELLRTLNRPTFVTIDEGFWDRRLCDSHYCILYLAIRDNQQSQIPSLIRQVFHLSAFKNKAVRMGKVARISSASIEYWQLGNQSLHVLSWPARSRKK